MNLYDRLLILIIASLSFGWLGGAMQPIRIISILLIPFVWLMYLYQKDYFVRVLYRSGCLFLFYAFVVTMINNQEGGVLSYIEWGYWIVNANLLLALLLFSRKAYNPRDSVALGWMIFVGITSIIGIGEIITGTHLTTNAAQYELMESGIALNGIENKIYAAATFGNYNEYVTALCSALPFLFYKLFRARTFTRIWFPILCVLLSGVIIVINASRGGIMCFALSVMTYLLYYRYSAFRFRSILLFCYFISVPLLLSKFGEVLFSQLMERSDSSMFVQTGRDELWGAAWETFCNSSGFGYGASVFHHEITPVPHSFFVEILVLYGLFGASFLIWLLRSIWLRTKKAIGASRFVLVTFWLMLIPYSMINSSYWGYAFFWMFLSSVLIFTIRENDNNVNSFI